MQNSEVFNQYGSERWVIEQELCFMMQQYWEECREKYGNIDLKVTEMPINPVSFIKKFMKQETIVVVEYAEKSKMAHLEKDVIDAEFTEVTGS